MSKETTNKQKGAATATTGDEALSNDTTVQVAETTPLKPEVLQPIVEKAEGENGNELKPGNVLMISVDKDGNEVFGSEFQIPKSALTKAPYNNEKRYKLKKSVQ